MLTDIWQLTDFSTQLGNFYRRSMFQENRTAEMNDLFGKVVVYYLALFKIYLDRETWQQQTSGSDLWSISTRIQAETVAKRSKEAYLVH